MSEEHHNIRDDVTLHGSEICLLYSTNAEVFLQSRVASNTALLWIEYLCLGGVCLT